MRGLGLDPIPDDGIEPEQVLVLDDPSQSFKMTLGQLAAFVNGFLALGTASTHNAQTAPDDATPGAVLINSGWGIGAAALQRNTEWLTEPGQYNTAIFQQTGGANDALFGKSGTGVYMGYGLNADSSKSLKGMIFLTSDGNLHARWSEIDTTTGAETFIGQRMYSSVPQAFSNSDPRATGADVNNILSNSTAFVFGDATNNNTGFDLVATCLANGGMSGYKTVIAAGYASSKVFIRTLNGDTGVWSPFIEINTSKTAIQDVALGAQIWKDYGGGAAVIADAGCVMTGLQEQQDDNEIHGYYFRSVNKFINGQWFIVSHLG